MSLEAIKRAIDEKNRAAFRQELEQTEEAISVAEKENPNHRPYAFLWEETHLFQGHTLLEYVAEKGSFPIVCVFLFYFQSAYKPTNEWDPLLRKLLSQLFVHLRKNTESFWIFREMLLKNNPLFFLFLEIFPVKSEEFKELFRLTASSENHTENLTIAIGRILNSPYQTNEEERTNKLSLLCRETLDLPTYHVRTPDKMTLYTRLLSHIAYLGSIPYQKLYPVFLETFLSAPKSTLFLNERVILYFLSIGYLKYQFDVSLDFHRLAPYFSQTILDYLEERKIHSDLRSSEDIFQSFFNALRNYYEQANRNFNTLFTPEQWQQITSEYPKFPSLEIPAAPGKFGIFGPSEQRKLQMISEDPNEIPDISVPNHAF